MCRYSLIAAVVFFWCELGVVVLPVLAREWNARNGTSSVEAELLDFRNGNVVLKRKDGRVIEVPLDKLSLADVKYVREALGEIPPTPAAKAESTPLKSAPTVSPEKAKPDVNAPLPPSAPRKPTQPELPPGPPIAKATSGRWQIVADPEVPDVAFKPADDLRIRVAKNYGDSLVIFPTTMSAFVGLTSSSSDTPIAVWNLKTGEKVGEINDKNGRREQMALSPDGQLMASSASSSEDIEIRAVADGSVFRKFPNAGRQTIRYMEFCNARRLVVITSGSPPMVTVFDVYAEEKAAAFQVEQANDEKSFAISPGGNYLAVVGAYHRPLDIVDLRNGAVAGSITLPFGNDHATVKALAFSRSGTELAGLFERTGAIHLLCWSLSDGKLTKQHDLGRNLAEIISFRSNVLGNELEFLGQKGWMVSGRAIIDREKGGPVWVDKSVERFHTCITRLVTDEIYLALVPTRPGEAQSLVTKKIPWDHIQAGEAAVASGATVNDVGLPPLTKTSSISAAKSVSYAPKSDGWSLPYEPTVMEASRIAANGILLDANIAQIRSISFSSPQAGMVALGTMVDPLRKSENNELQKIQRHNLQTGKKNGELSFAYPTSFSDLSPSGKRAAVLSGDDGERIDVWEFDGTKHVVGFRPFQAENTLRKVQRLAFLDEEHLLTQSQMGRLVLWKLPECSPVYVCDKAFQGVLEFNATRTQMVVWSGASYGLAAPITGEVLATLEPLADKKFKPVVASAFHPNGQRLALLLTDNQERFLAVWDLASGKLLCEETFAHDGRYVGWVSDNQVVVETPIMSSEQRMNSPDRARRYSLYDVERQQVVWGYRMPIGYSVGCSLGTRMWYYSASDYSTNAALIPAILPAERAQFELKKLPNLPPVLERGSQVSITARVVANGELATLEKLESALRARFTAQLADRGITVEQNSPLTMKITIVEKPTGEKKAFRVLGGFLPQTIVISLTQIACEIEIQQANGRSLWQRRTVIEMAPSHRFDQLPPGLTLEQYFRFKQWEDVGKWIDTATIPGRISHPIPGGMAGVSILSEKGETSIVPTPPPAEDKPPAVKTKSPLST